MDIYRIIVGVVLILAGIGYAVLRTLADAAGDPNEGFLGGFGPVLVGIGVAVAGMAIIIF